MRRLAAAALVTLGSAALATAGAAPAFAKDGDVRRSGNCSAASDWKLELGPRDGRIETEFEVDSNRAGQPWNVVISDNGTVVARTTATTVAPSGSFTVRRSLVNRAGVDHVVARATNPRTGETCTGTAQV